MYIYIVKIVMVCEIQIRDSFGLLNDIFLVCNQSLGMWRTMSATHTGWIQQWNYVITYSFML